MDTATVLSKYTLDLANFPLEIGHLLDELRNKDAQLAETRRKYQAKDAQIHKFIKANGTLAKNPKEPALASKIVEEMAQVLKLQKEKILLSNTALFLVSKHLSNLETDIAKLEADGLLAPVENLLELTGANGESNEGYSEMSRQTSASASSVDASMRKSQKRKMMKSIRPMKRFKADENEDDSPSRATPGDDADSNLYCFCQRVSFGEMIGCDNDDCKFEWFHWSCVGITSPPKDDEIWYCPDCSSKMEKRRKKRK